MQVIEYECKKCKYSFTRLYRDEKEAKTIKEKCIRCGGKGLKILQEFSLGEKNSKCASCKGCGKTCKK